jgi:hypothetical protein
MNATPDLGGSVLYKLKGGSLVPGCSTYGGASLAESMLTANNFREV